MAHLLSVSFENNSNFCHKNTTRKKKKYKLHFWNQSHGDECEDDPQNSKLHVNNQVLRGKPERVSCAPGENSGS